MSSAVALTLVLSFAAWLTLHLILVGRLWRGPKRWLSLLSLLPPLAPLAPYWAFHAGLRKSAVAWGLLLALYATARVLAQALAA